MKIGVLMGGISSEREVSLNSGKEIIKNLNKTKYDVKPIIIDDAESVENKVKGMDFIFIALHGTFGEDGKVQEILEKINMPYSGSGVFTSATCMDKNKTKEILKMHRIPVAPSLIIKNNSSYNIEEINDLGYPLVIKPNSGGSSIGTNLVKNQTEVRQCLDEAFNYDSDVMIEKYIKGIEYTAPILNGEVLPILTIKPSGEFFDYNSKYVSGKAEETYIKLTEELEKRIKTICETCWKIFNCKAYVRLDIIISEGIPYVLELNTLPGMTENSLFPKSAKEANISYSELLDKIIEYSLA